MLPRGSKNRLGLYRLGYTFITNNKSAAYGR
jgi:hypothetical protein